MHKLALLCKSYRGDVHRARRLAESIHRFNTDNIPFYLSAPSHDLTEFSAVLDGLPCNLLTDEDILQGTLRTYGGIPSSFPKHLVQQVVKLEFWRMGLCENYAWVDSDSYFIRPFRVTDFFYDDITPYTVCHESSELREFSARHNPLIAEDLERMARAFQNLFNRTGPLHDFGYTPIIWSSRVLESLNQDYIAQEGTTIFQLLQAYPCEMHLYGEYLLHSKAIPVHPIEPLFKVFHYVEQFLESQEQGESENSLARKYLGIVVQSNWARTHKKGPGERLRLILRRIRRRLRHPAD